MTAKPPPREHRPQSLGCSGWPPMSMPAASSCAPQKFPSGRRSSSEQAQQRRATAGVPEGEYSWCSPPSTDFARTSAPGADRRRDSDFGARADLGEGRVRRVPARCADVRRCNERPTRAGSNGDAPRTSESSSPDIRVGSCRSRARRSRSPWGSRPVSAAPRGPTLGSNRPGAARRCGPGHGSGTCEYCVPLDARRRCPGRPYG